MSWAWLGVTPFFLFALMFLILPTGFLFVGSFQDADGNCAGAGAAGACNGSFKVTALLPRAIPDGSGP